MFMFLTHKCKPPSQGATHSASKLCRRHNYRVALTNPRLRPLSRVPCSLSHAFDKRLISRWVAVGLRLPLRCLLGRARWSFAGRNWKAGELEASHRRYEELQSKLCALSAAEMGVPLLRQKLIPLRKQLAVVRLLTVLTLYTVVQFFFLVHLTHRTAARGQPGQSRKRRGKTENEQRYRHPFPSLLSVSWATINIIVLIIAQVLWQIACNVFFTTDIPRRIQVRCPPTAETTTTEHLHSQNTA